MSDTVTTYLSAKDVDYSSTVKKVTQTLETMTAAQEKRMALATKAETLTVKALAMEAAGQKKAADALKGRIALMEQAAKLASRTGMGYMDARRMVGEKASLQGQIAAQNTPQAATAGLSLPMVPLSADYMKSLDRTRMQTAKIAAQTKQISAASNSGALGFLALSQAVEDAQYGLKGVLNNIPMMVMGFGGGPGLAGAISLAAVALSMLWPELEKVTGKQARKQIEDGAKAFRESWRAAIADVKKEVADVAREKRFSGAFDRFEQATTMVFSIGSAAPMIAFYDKQLEKRKALRDTEREITEARIGLMRASGVSSESAQRASEAEAVAERLADAAIKQKQISQALVAGRRISGDSRETVSALRKDLEASEAEMVLLKYKLARSKADAERLAAMQKVGDVNAQVGVNLRLSANKAPGLESEIADEVARQEMLRKKIELTEKTARESIDTLHQTVQARTDEITALKAEAAKLEELNKIRDKEREIIRQRDALENARRYGDEQARKAEEFRQEKERAAEVRRKEAEVKARQADFAAEFIAAKLRANGRAGMADALEKEIALRREAKDLAESLNIHEQWALTLLRRKAEMLERAAGGPGEARRARREIGYGASRLQGREGFLHGSASLRNAEMERRNRRAAADAAQSRKDPAAAYWERQLDLQQQLVKHFEKLGAA